MFSEEILGTLIPEAVARSCSIKICSREFCKINNKTYASKILFNEVTGYRPATLLRYSSTGTFLRIFNSIFFLKKPPDDCYWNSIHSFENPGNSTFSNVSGNIKRVSHSIPAKGWNVCEHRQWKVLLSTALPKFPKFTKKISARTRYFSKVGDP